MKGRIAHDKSGTRGWKVDSVYTIFNARTDKKEDTTDYYAEIIPFNY